MKRLATIGDNCVDIYPHLGKAFSGGNAVNVAVYSTRYGMRHGCVTWVGEDDYGRMLKDDPQRWGRHQPCACQTRRHRANAGRAER